MSHVTNDLAKIGKALEDAGAIVTEPDGYRWVDVDKEPRLARLYSELLATAYARGDMP